jgi:hypothetical protein
MSIILAGGTNNNYYSIGACDIRRASGSTIGDSIKNATDPTARPAAATKIWSAAACALQRTPRNNLAEKARNGRIVITD